MQEMDQIRTEIVRLKEVSRHIRLLLLCNRSHHGLQTRISAI